MPMLKWMRHTGYYAVYKDKDEDENEEEDVGRDEDEPRLRRWRMMRKNIRIAIITLLHTHRPTIK